MRVVDDAVIAGWHGRAINIHPSLLPKYPGLHTHRRVLDARDTEHGASVHFVTAELDGGPVIAQVELDIRNGDDAASLAERLLPLEHHLLVATVEAIARGRIMLGERGVVFDSAPLNRPLRLNAGGILEV
jgi:phosphoribosylglycinamide formyltransferase-1